MQHSKTDGQTLQASSFYVLPAFSFKLWCLWVKCPSVRTRRDCAGLSVHLWVSVYEGVRGQTTIRGRLLQFEMRSFTGLEPAKQAELCARQSQKCVCLHLLMPGVRITALPFSVTWALHSKHKPFIEPTVHQFHDVSFMCLIAKEYYVCLNKNVVRLLL